MAESAKKRKRGRPPVSKAKLDIIIELLQGGESLQKICQNPDMPSMKTVFNRLDADEDFFHRYTRAREIQADMLFEELLAISDDRDGDIGDDGKVQRSVIERARLKIDTRKWILARLNPKKYSDNQRVEVTGKDGSPLAPPSIVIQPVKVEDGGKK